MRKLYALLAGLLVFFASVHVQEAQAQAGTPDSCTANFERLPLTGTTPLMAGFQAIPGHNLQKKPVLICWTFGDGRDTCIQYATTYTGTYTVNHMYAQPGSYNVCVRIRYDGGCVSEKCKPVVIGQVTPPDSCGANFEAGPFGINPLGRSFTAIPQHNNNKKPVSICWVFGDGRDTCIQYANTFPGPYNVNHTYAQPGLYNVCVRIVYQGGCVAEKCKPVQVGAPDSCTADYERIPVSSNNPLSAAFKAIPGHSNNKKPQRICWTFGDGRDTCITYPSAYTGLYTVNHQYAQPGVYEVCVKILYDGGCEARKCKAVQIGAPDTCRADFDRTPFISNTPLVVALKALPAHNNNKKPQQICWVFGDGKDTCINYTETYTGDYTVTHRYPRPDTFRVCVRIKYYGGCVAEKCKPIVVGNPQRCSVRILQIIPSATSLVRGFFAYPQSVPVRPVESICWYFGDGSDTCILMDSVINPGNLFIRHTYPAPGAYRACVKVRFRGGCIAEDCVPVFIRSNTSICGGFMVDSMTAPRSFVFRGHGIQSPGDEVVSYRWNFGDGSNATGQEVSHTYTAAGDFEVCLTLRTQRGCETRICKKVRVPGNNMPALVLNPNPVINNLHVLFRSSHTETVNIRIMSANGIIVRNTTKNVVAGENVWDFNLADLIPGTYSFTVQSPNQLASAVFFKQ